MDSSPTSREQGTDSPSLSFYTVYLAEVWGARERVVLCVYLFVRWHPCG